MYLTVYIVVHIDAMLELCVHRTVDGRLLGLCDWLTSDWRLSISTGSRHLVTDFTRFRVEGLNPILAHSASHQC